VFGLSTVVIHGWGNASLWKFSHVRSLGWKVVELAAGLVMGGTMLCMGDGVLLIAATASPIPRLWFLLREKLVNNVPSVGETLKREGTVKSATTSHA
jgi:hypothetical protein